MYAFLILLTRSQKMKNNYVYGLSNPALRQAQEGVVELHLPPVDMTAVLKEVDREFVKQHPLMKKVLEEESGVGGKGGEEDVNTPLKDEKEEEKTVVISDAEIEANRLNADEMMKLPQMRNVRVGGRVFL